MSINFKKNLKELYAKRQEHSFFHEFAEKNSKIIPPKNPKSHNKIIVSNIKNKFCKSQSFGTISFDNNLNGNSCNRQFLNRTINTIEQEMNIRNLINNSVEKVDKIIKKHSLKKTKKTVLICPVTHNKSSTLVIIEEKEEDGFKKKDIKKSVPSKIFEGKKNLTTNFNRKVLPKQSKNSVPKQPYSKPVTPVDLHDKKMNYDFLQGFKDKMKCFLKNKNKKEPERVLKPNLQNNFMSPLMNYRKNHQKSLSKTPVSKVVNVRPIDYNSQKVTSKFINKTPKTTNIKRKFDSNGASQQFKIDQTINDEALKRYNNFSNYYSSISSPNGNMINRKISISISKGKNRISPILLSSSISPSRNKETLFRNKTLSNFTRSKEIISSDSFLQKPINSNPLNHLLTNDINYRIINIKKILEFILIYKEVNSMNKSDNITTLIYHLKKVLEQQDKFPLSNSSSSLQYLNTDFSKHISMNEKEKEAKAKIIQKKWRLYKAKRILNLEAIDKTNLNNICREYLTKQLISNTQNFGFVTELFSLILNLWEDMDKISIFQETKNYLINIKNYKNYSELVSDFLTNILRLRQIQRENISENTKLF